MRTPQRYEDEEAHSLMRYLLFVFFGRRGEVAFILREMCSAHKDAVHHMYVLSAAVHLVQAGDIFSSGLCMWTPLSLCLR